MWSTNVIQHLKHKSWDEKTPTRRESPNKKSQTIWINNKAYPRTESLPALLASQAPLLTTRAPLHAASSQPHEYVTPLAPQTRSSWTQFIGQANGFGTPPQMSPPACPSAACKPIKQKTRKSKAILTENEENDAIMWIPSNDRNPNLRRFGDFSQTLRVTLLFELSGGTAGPSTLFDNQGRNPSITTNNKNYTLLLIYKQANASLYTTSNSPLFLSLYFLLK